MARSVKRSGKPKVRREYYLEPDSELDWSHAPGEHWYDSDAIATLVERQWTYIGLRFLLVLPIYVVAVGLIIGWSAQGLPFASALGIAGFFFLGLALVVNIAVFIYSVGLFKGLFPDIRNWFRRRETFDSLTAR